MVAYETIFNIIFEKPGKFEILYKKDTTVDANGESSGAVQIYVDSDSVIYDDKIDSQNEWKLFTVDVVPGLRTISIIYEKYNSPENEN